MSSKANTSCLNNRFHILYLHSRTPLIYKKANINIFYFPKLPQNSIPLCIVCLMEVPNDSFSPSTHLQICKYHHKTVQTSCPKGQITMKVIDEQQVGSQQIRSPEINKAIVSTHFLFMRVQSTLNSDELPRLKSAF